MIAMRRHQDPAPLGPASQALFLILAVDGESRPAHPGVWPSGTRQAQRSAPSPAISDSWPW